MTFMLENTSQLSQDLKQAILQRLGFSVAPVTDRTGLTALYSAWCRSVPFDNIRKMIALRSSERALLPGIDAVDFFEAWLEHGCGGTCWPSSNALFELVRAVGFNARRVAGSMRDLGVVSHASVKVKLDGADWLVDSSLLSNIPLPLRNEVFIGKDPVFVAEVEVHEGAHVIWTDMPPNSSYLPCRLMMDPTDHVFYAERYEATRAQSPFNQRLYARINRPGQMVILFGATRFTKTAQGLQKDELSRDELCESLRGQFGYSRTLVDQWIACGGLDASLQPPSGPKPPDAIRLPPSRR